MAKRPTTTERLYHPLVRYTMLSRIAGHWLVTILDNGVPAGRPSLFLLTSPNGQWRLTDDGQTIAAAGVEIHASLAGVIRGFAHVVGVGGDMEIWRPVPDHDDLEVAILRFAGVLTWLADGLACPSLPDYQPPRRARRPAVERHRNRRQKPNRTRPAKRPRSRSVAKDVPGTRIHTRRVQTMVAPDAYKKLESEADQCGISVSALVRRLINAHLARPEAQHGEKQ